MQLKASEQNSSFIFFPLTCYYLIENNSSKIHIESKPVKENQICKSSKTNEFDSHPANETGNTNKKEVSAGRSFGIEYRCTVVYLYPHICNEEISLALLN